MNRKTEILFYVGMGLLLTFFVFYLLDSLNSGKSKDDAKTIDAKGQIEYFADHFYSFDGNNIEPQLNKALTISDSSVKALFENYKRADWYNKIVQYNIFQTCQLNDINVDMSHKPVKASFSAMLFLRKGSNVQRLTFSAKCDLVETTKVFPKNVLGLTISNYKQSETKLIK